MELTVKLEGMDELERTLGDLPQATGRNASLRGLKEAGEPVARHARSLVRERYGDLKESIDVSPRLSQTQREEHKALGDKADVEVHIGPGPNPQAITEEFGKYNQDPHPYLRPAWEAEKEPTLDRLGAHLWAEIEKSAARHARKTARLKG